MTGFVIQKGIVAQLVVWEALHDEANKHKRI
jgi:hypothetical protein